jgi:hypothetical protein
MKNKKGASAGSSRPFSIGGEIHVGAPGLLSKLAKGEQVVLGRESGGEFILHAENSEKETFFEISPLICIQDADVKITTAAKDDWQPDAEYFFINIKDASENCFGLELSPAQARELASILADYVQAHDAWERLHGTRRVPAKRGTL